MSFGIYGIVKMSPFLTPPFGIVDSIVFPFTTVENTYPSLRSLGALTFILLFRIDFGLIGFTCTSESTFTRNISPFFTSLGCRIEKIKYERLFTKR